MFEYYGATLRKWTKIVESATNIKHLRRNETINMIVFIAP